MTPHVDDLPQPFLGDDADRLHDRGVVDLVDVVLVQQQRGARRRTARPARSAAAPVLQEEERRDADAGERDDRSTRAISVELERPASARRRRASTRAAAPKLGSRNCSNRSRRRARAAARVAGDDRADREHDQRERHRRRRVVQMRAACAVPWARAMPGARGARRCSSQVPGAPTRARARRGTPGTRGGTCRSRSAATSAGRRPTARVWPLA